MHSWMTSSSSRSSSRVKLSLSSTSCVRELRGRGETHLVDGEQKKLKNKKKQRRQIGFLDFFIFFVRPERERGEGRWWGGRGCWLAGLQSQDASERGIGNEGSAGSIAQSPEGATRLVVERRTRTRTRASNDVWEKGRGVGVYSMVSREGRVVRHSPPPERSAPNQGTSRTWSLMTHTRTHARSRHQLTRALLSPECDGDAEVPLSSCALA